MLTLGSLPPDAQHEAPRSSVVKPTLLIVAMLAIGYVIVQLVLQSPMQQRARAARAFDAIAAARPDETSATIALSGSRMFIVSDQSVAGETFRQCSPAFGLWDGLRLRLHMEAKLASMPAIPAAVGEMNFKDGKWVSGRNLVTGKDYPAETTAPLQTAPIPSAGVE